MDQKYLFGGIVSSGVFLLRREYSLVELGNSAGFRGRDVSLNRLMSWKAVRDEIVSRRPESPLYPVVSSQGQVKKQQELAVVLGITEVRLGIREARPIEVVLLRHIFCRVSNRMSDLGDLSADAELKQAI